VNLDSILDRADRALRLLERIAAAVESLATHPALPAANDGAPELWTVREVAKVLKCSESKVYRYAESGKLPRVMFGGQVRFEPEAVRGYLRGEQPAGAQVLPLTRGT
jgi:excisionase family DNA binding protein